MGRATRAPRMGMSADVPPLRPRPTLGMADMGMAGMAGMGGMDNGAMAGMDHSGMDHGGVRMREPADAPAGMKVGVGVDMAAPMPPARPGPPDLRSAHGAPRHTHNPDLHTPPPNPHPP